MKEPDNEWAMRMLARIAQRDESALRELHRVYARRIYAFALNRLHDEGEAQAVVTDTLWEVWKQPQRFNGASKLSTWILGIARYKLLNLLRDRMPPSDELDEALPADEPGPYDMRLATEHRAAILGCLETLTSAHRECLQMVFFQELPLAEIAAVQGCPENTVKTRLFHARQNMKKCLEGKLGQDR